MSVWPNRHISYYVGTFGKHFMIFDVTKCRETTIVRIENTLRRYDDIDTAAVERITQNGKSIIIRTPAQESKTLYLFKKDGQYGQIIIPDDGTYVDFIETYFAS